MTVKLDKSSIKCPGVTDQSYEPSLEMTNKFLLMFYSGMPVVARLYMADDAIWRWATDIQWLVSPRTEVYYRKWKESLSTLLKELA